MADVQVKRKVVVPGRMLASSSRPSSPTKIRPPSPVKRFPVQTLPQAGVAPAPRLKAKVSSSANTAANRKPQSTLSPGYVSGSSTPRATSPVRQSDSRQGRLSPKPSSSVLSRVRATPTHAAASAPTSPLAGFPQQALLAAIPASTSDPALVRTSPPRVRHASISSASQLSSATSSRTNGVLSPPLSVVSQAYESDVQSDTSTRKIKAKLTSIAKGKPPTAPSSPMLAPSPMSSPPQQFQRRIGRTASISSLSSSKEPIFYPITTASPVANAHRFATVHTPSVSRRSSNCFPSPLQAAHVDPSHVPLPPHSPPASAVSFSSQSSVSRSTSSSVNNDGPAQFNSNNLGHYTQPRKHDATHLMNGESSKPRSLSIILGDLTNGRVRQGSIVSNGADELDEEQTMRAEAKSIRKIADLEITNKSLLSINSQLEANKHKQAKEIRELRRKLRESRLVLPPRTYRALKEDGPEEGDDDEADEEEDKDGEEAFAEIDTLGKDDELFSRVRSILDALLDTGRRALQTGVEDFAPARGGAKVLHEEEARTWRDSGSHSRTSVDREPGNDTFDETFVTAESGDEGAAFTLGMVSSDTVRGVNASAESLVQVVVKDVDSI